MRPPAGPGERDGGAPRRGVRAKREVTLALDRSDADALDRLVLARKVSGARPAAYSLGGVVEDALEAIAAELDAGASFAAGRVAPVPGRAMVARKVKLRQAAWAEAQRRIAALRALRPAGSPTGFVNLSFLVRAGLELMADRE